MGGTSIAMYFLVLSHVFTLSCSEGVNMGSDGVLVTLPQGRQLRGWRTRLTSGDIIYKFYGIHYAAAPTGELRFKPPEAAEEWTGVKDARTRGSICTQVNSGKVSGSEDCLFLNVYSPNVNSTSLPVMFWIHGGAYHQGSGNADPTTLVQRGIVVVTINYRLGAFGFMSTGDTVMPGNYAMLDLVFALKWVQTNIAAFGGDANRVTVAGQSAGAHSVSLLTISPLAQGLFKKAIIESGSALCSSAVEKEGTLHKVKDYTLYTASLLGCNQTTSAHILTCLRQADAAALVLAAEQTEKHFDVSILAETRVEHTYGFLPDYPLNLLVSGKFNPVDTLSGYNSGEWSHVIQDSPNNGLTREEFVKYFKGFYKKNSFTNNNYITNLVQTTFLGNETDPFKIRSRLVEALAFITFGGASNLELVKKLSFSASANKHFYYEFGYRPSSLTSPWWYGATHSSELQAVFFHNSSSTTAADRTVADTVQTMWVNFIQSGSPTPTGTGTDLVHWDQYTLQNPKIIKLNVTSVLVNHPRPELLNVYEQALGAMKTLAPLASSTIVG